MESKLLNIKTKIGNCVIDINYTLHVLGLYDRPFKAIQKGTKTIEVRTNTKEDPFNYQKIEAGDLILFVNEITGEKIKLKVSKIKWYPTAEELLRNEKIKKVLSSNDNLYSGVNAIHSIPGYKEGIKTNGVCAIHLIKKL